MFTADEAAAIKRFLNSFDVRLWNGREPYVDRSNPFGEYSIYIPRTAGIDYTKFCFGFKLTRSVDESENVTWTITIYPGKVRLHGLRTYSLDASVDITLTAEVEHIYAVVNRVSGSAVTIDQATEEPTTTGTTMKLPLYTVEKTGSAYGTPTIHHLGDFDFDTPIR
jgi:hypothetical protein